MASSDGAPPWLLAMRSITGMTETPGSADNPKILQMARTIGERWPEQKAYSDSYKHDDTPWCGLTVAYCMTMAEIEPVFGPTDTDRWMWALAWSEWHDAQRISAPRLGCVVVMEREGGGHVTLFEHMDGNNYACRGGNQGDMVNVSSYAPSTVVALMWPAAGGPLPPAERRELEEGDTGSDVAEVQRTLAIPPYDGEFGQITDQGVRAFQAACRLDKDGVVGSDTWAALDDLDKKMTDGDDGIPEQLATDIDHVVDSNADVQAISWKDRGKPPDGYYNGMAKTFAVAIDAYNKGDSGAAIMAQKATGNADKDALTWYASEFAAKNMKNDKNGLDTLRHLFVLMVGLGMRESSGVCWEGRDMSASNVASETAEAGLFQTSWNINGCSPTEIKALLAEYWSDPNGFQPIFAKGLAPSENNLALYGSGDGARYQWLAKQSPAFAALVTAIGLRKLRAHWGPIGRKEVEIKTEVDKLLQSVQDLAGAAPAPEPEPEPEPEPIPEPGAPAVVTITVETEGSVVIHTINKAKPDGRS